MDYVQYMLDTVENDSDIVLTCTAVNDGKVIKFHCHKDADCDVDIDPDDKRAINKKLGNRAFVVIVIRVIHEDNITVACWNIDGNVVTHVTGEMMEEAHSINAETLEYIGPEEGVTYVTAPFIGDAFDDYHYD